MMKRVTQHVEHVAHNSSVGKKIITCVVLCVAILGAIAFIPGTQLSIAAGKWVLMSLGFCIAIIGLVVAFTERAPIRYPRHWIFPSLLGITVLGLISLIFIPSPAMSWLGYGPETTTIFFLILFGGFIFLSAQVLRSYDTLSALFFGIFGISTLVMILHILRFLVGPQLLRLGILGGNTATLVGAWSDLSILLGLVTLLSIFTLEMAPFQRGAKTFVGIVGAMALVMLVVMNNHKVLIIVGLLVLLGSLYLFFTRDDSSRSGKIPWYGVVVFIVICLGIFLGGRFNQFASRHNSIIWNDVMPPMSYMIDAGTVAVRHNPLMGYGLNTFPFLWNNVKPVELSGTVVGDLEMRVGYGFIPTQMATQGILGIIGWIVFSVSLLITLFYVIRRTFVHDAQRYFIVTLSGLVTYLFIISWAYIPGNYILILFAILLGSFLGILGTEKLISEKILFVKPGHKLVTIVSIVLIVVTLLGGYVIVKNGMAMTVYARGTNLLAANNREEGIKKIMRASQLMRRDVYSNKLAEIAVEQLFSLVQTSTEDKESISAQAEQLLSYALGNSTIAIKSNQLNYKNYIALGNLYRIVISLGLPEAYERSLAAYSKAESLNPRDSTLKLLSAQSAVTADKSAEAMSFVKQSLEQYPTRGGYIMQAQLETKQGNWGAVATSLEQAIIRDPQNVILYLNLGVAYEKSGASDKADKIYTMIRSQFNNADEAISKIRSEAGLR